MKRFSDTARFDQEWYADLPPEMKCAWEYLWAKCDSAGVWVTAFRLADFTIGKKVDWEGFRKRMGDRIFTLPNGSWVLVEFVRHQCGALSESCPAHKPVIALLRKHGLMPPDSLSIDYCMSINRQQEEEEEEETDKEKEQETEKPRENVSAFDEFWQAYPLRVGKQEALKAWTRRRCDKLLPQILSGVRRCKISQAWTKEAGRYIPHPATWLNRGGWEDDLTPELNGLGKNSRLPDEDMPPIITA
jgi:hypothetical protein